MKHLRGRTKEQTKEKEKCGSTPYTQEKHTMAKDEIDLQGTTAKQFVVQKFSSCIRLQGLLEKGLYYLLGQK